MAGQTSIPIAIIGIGCRLPGGVRNTTELWELLVEGQNAWSAVPVDRFNESAFYHPNPDNKGTTNHRGGHFISQNVAAFDAAFFNISPIEAQAIDPQHRLLLETTYEAFENAGIPIEEVRGSDTAVYTAIFTRDYDRNIYKDPNDIPKYHVTGSGEAIASNRISYTFDLKGPSMTLDTGCSGGTVALHQACQSLRTGESSMALASGVNLILNPDHMFSMSNLHMLNDHGRSYSFDVRGSGYGRGEGIAAVLLKRLDDALQARDNVRAIIRNTAVNQDGKTNGITLPSQQAQESLHKTVFARAGLDPWNIQYIEAHGTGTAAGDLAELQGIANVFCGNERALDNDLYVGSIKSNLGHLESASGLAGLIKTVLILENGLIPPNAEFQAPKSNLKLKEWRIKVPSKLEKWPNPGTRQASVNSFGYGGTNAHVILESASTSVPVDATWEAHQIDQNSGFKCPEGYNPNPNGLELDKAQNIAININPQVNSSREEPESNGVVTSEKGHPLLSNQAKRGFKTSGINQPLASIERCVPQLFVMSAKSRKSLREVLQRLRGWLITRHNFEHNFRSLAYNLSYHRSLFEWRHTTVASSHEELVNLLNPKDFDGNRASSNIRVGFVFTGQGAQWFGMGRSLIFTHSLFAKSLIKSDTMLRDLGAPWSLIEELLRDESSSRINQSEIAQPASTALQIAIVDLLEDIGVRPQVVLGHSSGEIAAAYATGVLSHVNAIKVAYCRSFISSYYRPKNSNNGAMLAVNLSEDEVLPLIIGLREGVVSVACVNSSSSTVVSGDDTAILEVEKILKQLSVSSKRLKVDTAYHSHHMQQVAPAYLRSLGHIDTQPLPTNIKYISSVTAAEKTSDFGPGYWVENLVSKVRFYDAVNLQLANWQLMIPQSTHVLIEIGPHSVFAGPIRQTVTQNFDSLKCVYVPTLVRSRDAVHSVLDTVGKMFEQGFPVNFAVANSLNGTYPNQHKVIHDLPTYPWDHSNTYWHESRLSKDYRLRPHPYHDLLGVRTPTSSLLEPSWRHIISTESLPWLVEHIVDNLIIFPGAGYVCMAIEAVCQLIRESQEVSETVQFVLKDVIFSKALIVPPAPKKVEVQLNLRTRRIARTKWHEFRVISQEEIWYEHCSGIIKAQLDSQALFMTHGDQLNLDQDNMLTNDEPINTMTTNSPKMLDSKDLYSQLRSNGNFYGPSFSAVEELKVAKSSAVGHISIPDIQSKMPSKYMQSHIIHPATLDALMHPSLPLYTNMYGAGSVMPMFISGINISAKISKTPGRKLKSVATLTPNGARSAMTDISVFEANMENMQEPVLKISQLNLFGFGTTKIDTLDSPGARNMSFQFKWGADVDFFSLKTRPSLGSVSIDDYFKHLCFKQSKMKVLQVGAGSGKATVSILKALRMLPLDWIDLISFTKLDIEKTSAEPEFSRHTYDLIISTSPVSTKGYLEAALSNLHKLLKHGGRLLLVAKESPLISRDDLHGYLLRHSYNGVELLIENSQGMTEKDVMIVSKSISPDHQVPSLAIEIIAGEETRSFADCISLALKSHGFEVSLVTWGTDFSKSHVIYLIVDNGQKPLLVNPSSRRFKQITRLSKESSNIFWISAHEDASATMNSGKGLVVGLARSARSENYHLKFVTLDVQEVISSCLSELLEIIEKIILASFANVKQPDQLEEFEYAYRDGRVKIPRLIPDPLLSSWMTQRADKPTAVETTSYGQRSRPLKLQVPISGSAYFIDAKPIQMPLNPSSVEIDVKAHGLSPGDSVNSLGQGESSSTSVREFAGIVSSVGAEASTKFCVGDRVCGWSCDGVPYANHIDINAQNIVRLPDSISLENGAAIPISFMTAYHSLVKVADLQRGQTVLIHSAAGDMGEAALAIAQYIGAKVLATVSSNAEENYLATSHGLSYRQIFSEEATHFSDRMLRITQGNGIDVVFDPYASELFLESWASMASLGVYIRIGQERDYRNGNMCMPGEKNATFVSFDLATLICCRPQKVATLLKEVISVFELGSTLPHQRIIKISIANVRDAIELIKIQKHIGKVVLEASSDTQVKVKTYQDVQPTNQSKLDPTAMYVIAGGLGDLGQKLCRLMASRGAQFIMLLSRRVLNYKSIQALQDDLQAGPSGVKVYSMACDISDSSVVHETVSSFEKLKLPPVKGIVQCATVLQDCVLESMTADNFQVPLQTKVYGTRHLSDAFKKMSLDFFVMLSSLSGTIGTKGQANYAAGNTFQDSFAHNQMNSKTHYISLNLGMIEGTAVYENSEGRSRSKNLLSQGFISVKSEELLAFLDYAISSQARKDQCRQAIIGIDGRSIAEAEDATPTTKNGMFIHVRSSYSNKLHGTSGSCNDNRKQTIADAKSLPEVHQIINAAVVKKLSSLIALEHDRINLESPLSEFGIDSLNAIQLKSWIAREFDAAIQTSEILDESSIIALSMRVASRSTLIQEFSEDSFRQNRLTSEIEQESDSGNIIPKPNTNRHQHNTDKAIVLPQLPLPDLQGTLELYRTSARSFLSEDQIKHISTLIQEFQQGSGMQLQLRLMDRKHDSRIENWQYDLQVSSIYLKRRDPVYPYGVFYGSHLLTETPHSQAERAAIISIAAYKFKIRLDAGKLEQDYMNEDPICMDSLQWLFNASRTPCIGKDTMCKYAGNDYLVALRSGNVFKVPLVHRGKPASYESLQASFRVMLDISKEKLPPVAALTADQRDTWTELRKTLMVVSPANNILINIIEAAAFVVCLDDGSPASSTERCNQFLVGDPSNRWSDKSLQFVVCENGASAYICEHSMLDAISLKQINKYISEAILEHNPETLPENTDNLDASFEKHTFVIDETIKSHIARVQEQFQKAHKPVELNHFYLPNLGHNYLRAHKIPSKTGLQLIIQLASVLHFGRHHPSWETLTMAPFRKGRVDWMQVVSPAMYRFCHAAAAPLLSAPTTTTTSTPPYPAPAATSPVETLQLLRGATQAHTSTMTRIARGKGFMAHLTALRGMVLPHEPLPPLFLDQTWQALMDVTSGARKIKTDASEDMGVREAGFWMPDPESVLVHYEVGEEGARIFVQGREGVTEKFFGAVKRAAGVVRGLLEL